MAIILLSLSGCLFIDSSTSCEDTNTCSRVEVYGEYLNNFGDDCYQPLERAQCAEENCDSIGIPEECSQRVLISLTNVGNETATISEPEQLELHSNAGFEQTSTIEKIEYVMNVINADLAGEPQRASNVQRLIQLEPGESVEVAISFSKNTEFSGAAEARITFEVQNHDALIITTDPIKFNGYAPLETTDTESPSP